MASKEQLQPLDNLNVLKEGRFEASRIAAEMSVRQTFANNSLHNPDTIISNLTPSYFPSQYSSLSVSGALALEGIGVDLNELAKQMSENDPSEVQNFKTLEVGNEIINVKTQGNNSLQITFNRTDIEDNSEVKPELFNKLVEDRFARSPGHRELGRIHDQIKDVDVLPPVLTTEPFNPQEDLLGTKVFLTQIGAIGHAVFDISSTGSVLTADSLLRSLLDMPEFRGTVTETDDAYIANLGHAAKKQLIIDKKTGFYTLSVEPDEANFYLETPNQAAYTRSEPFIETECAKDLCRQLDEVGLMFHPAVQLEIMDIKESDRYGNIYTYMSREIAKWVNRPDRMRLSKLFVPIDEDNYGLKLIQRTKQWGPSPRAVSIEYENGIEDTDVQEALVRDLWSKLSGNQTGEAAGVLLDLVTEVVARTKTNQLFSELPVTNEQISITRGACFDVSSYYIGGAGQSLLRNVEVGDVKLIEKTHGSHTFMTTSSTIFNGVKLPKGALLSQQQDGGWAFLRLTPFTFDNESDQSAFGSEMAKTYYNETQALRAIGGTTLSHLLKNTRASRV